MPGLREELVTSLLRSLPKNLRVSFVPAPNTAKDFLARVPAGDEALLDALERYLRSTTGVVVPRDAWDWEKVPAHLRPTYRVVDDAGSEQARGKDLEALKAPLQPAFDAALAEVASDVGLSATGQTTWTFGTVEESVVQRRAGHEVRGHPALVDEGATVGLGVFGSADEAEARHRLGVDACSCWGCAPSTRWRAWTTRPSWGWPGRPTRPSPSWSTTCAPRSPGRWSTHTRRRATRRRTPRSRKSSTPSRRSGSPRASPTCCGCWPGGGRPRSGSAAGPKLLTLAAMQDMRAQVGRLVDRGFVGEAGLAQLRRYPTYLAAVEHRRERLDAQVAKDAQLMTQVADVQEAYLNQVAALPAGRPPGVALRRVRWMLEEYRVSLWAQQLGTAYSVSDQRIRKALHESATPRS